MSTSMLLCMSLLKRTARRRFARITELLKRLRSSNLQNFFRKCLDPFSLIDLFLSLKTNFIYRDIKFENNGGTTNIKIVNKKPKLNSSTASDFKNVESTDSGTLQPSSTKKLMKFALFIFAETEIHENILLKLFSFYHIPSLVRIASNPEEKYTRVKTFQENFPWSI